MKNYRNFDGQTNKSTYLPTNQPTDKRVHREEVIPSIPYLAPGISRCMILSFEGAEAVNSGSPPTARPNKDHSSNIWII